MKKIFILVIVLMFTLTLSGCDKVVSEEDYLLQRIEPSEYIIEQEYSEFTGACIVSMKVGSVMMCTLYQKFWNLDYSYVYDNETVMEIRMESGMSVSPIMWFHSSLGEEVEGAKPICKYERTIFYESGETKIKIKYDFCE